MGTVNFIPLFKIATSMLLVIYSGSSSIIGDWKPVEQGVGCGDLITFTERSTFQLKAGGKNLIEGTYQSLEENKYLLNFLNGDKAEAKIMYHKKKIILTLINSEGELCKSYKSTTP